MMYFWQIIGLNAQEQLIEKFHAIVSQYHLMIDKNIT